MCFWLLQQKFGGSKFPNLVLHGVIEASLHQGTARHWRIVPPPPRAQSTCARAGAQSTCARAGAQSTCARAGAHVIVGVYGCSGSNVCRQPRTRCRHVKKIGQCG